MALKQESKTIAVKRKQRNAISSSLLIIREILIGNEQDFTSGKISRAIFLLSVPMVIEMLSEAFFAIADIYFVAQLGAEAVAAVGITESLMTIVYAIGAGLSTATTAIISRRIGEKNKEAGSVAAVQAVLCGIIISLFIAVPGIVFGKDLLKFMGASAEITGLHYKYTVIMLGGNGIIMLLFIINAVFRSAGDASISMRVLLLANMLNIILDPCLIHGIGPFPRMGIEGAAIATTIGRGTAVIFQVYLLIKGVGRIKVLIKHICFRMKVILKLIRLSIGGIGQNIIATSSWIILIRITAEFGSEVLAGYTVAIRIILFVLLPSWGIGNAASTLVGQNLGAGKPQRAERSVWYTSVVNMCLLSLVSLLFIFHSEFFIRLFINESLVVAKGIICLRIISYGLLFYGLGMVMIQAFNGAGDTVTPTIINLFCFWLIEIPLAYLLALHYHINETGVYISIVLAESLLALTALALFRRGKWKLRIV